MDKPFLPLVISFIIGILISNYFNLSLNYLLIGLFIGIISLVFCIWKDKKSFLNIIIIFVFLGMIITTLKMESKVLNYVDERMEYLGVVEEILPTDDNLSRYIVKIERNIDTNESINERIRLNIVGEKTLRFGERIVFDGELQKPLDNTNPMLYNHRMNLLSNNIYGSMTINDYSLKLVDTPRDLRFRIKEGFCNEVNRIFDTNLDEGNRDIIKSMVLGDSSYLEDYELHKYRELGLGHILAVSGLHIGIISSFILYLLMSLTIPRRVSSIITIAIIVFYGYLIGFPHSMMRGIIMFSLIILTKLLHEHSNPINILSISALIVLFINPFSLFSLGFILSYIAVLSLYLFTKKIEMFFYLKKGYLISTISAILAVNIGLLPIQAYYFNYVSLLGILANLINIPILSLSLVLSISMLLLDYILPFFNIGLSILVNFLLNMENFIGDILYNLSGWIFNVPSPTMNMMIIYYLAIAILFKIVDATVFDRNVKKSILIYICLIISVNFVNIAMDDSMELHFIDVGQGDSILIRSRGKDVLVDTGGSLLSNYVGEQITLPYLQKLGIRELDGIIISHFDADHCGGLPTLIDNLKINNIFGSYVPEDEIIINSINKSKIPFIVLKSGDSFRINEDILCDVLWPIESETLNNNNKSLVMLLNYKDYKILLTGDIEREAELELLDSIPSNIDILKVAHHGSDTSTISEFTHKVKPKNSIISVGRNNQFNHPSDDVIDRLNEINSIVYRTDEMGLIKVHMDEDLIIYPYIKQSNNSIGEFIYKNGLYLTFSLIYYIISKKLIILYERSGADINELCWIYKKTKGR